MFRRARLEPRPLKGVTHDLDPGFTVEIIKGQLGLLLLSSGWDANPSQGHPIIAKIYQHCRNCIHQQVILHKF